MPTDEELAARLARGDEGALRELLRRYERPLASFIHRHTGGHDVDDLFQETWWRVVRHSARFDPGRRFSTWLFQIAVNLCRDLARKQRPAAFAELDLEDSMAPEEAIEDQAPLLLEAVAERELEQALAHAVTALPEAYRAVVTLRYTEGLSYEDLAAALGLPVNTVRTHLFRAKAMLRQMLADWV